MQKSIVSAIKIVTAMIAVAVCERAFAADVYWDSNGTDPGAGANPVGTWGTSAFWNSLADGTGTPGAWVSGDTAIFSAGADASGAFTVTVSGTQVAGGVRVEEGSVTLGTGTVNVNAGNITVESGATLSTDSSLRIAATAGSTVTINGGTVRTTNPSNAGSFVDIDFVINLGAGGGTFAQTVNNILNIVQTTTVISGPGSLTKTGVGVLAIASPSTYSGSTIINDGELRIRSTADRIPVTTPVIVNAPGILNLNSVAQRIGSLSGNGDVGLGAATLTVGDSTSTTYSGALKNVANAGAGAVSSGAGRVIKTGSGTLTLSGANSYTGSLTISNGAVTVASGATLCDPLADILIQGGTLNLDNATQTILSLQGTGGSLNLGTGNTLTVNPGNVRTNAGTIGGPGALSKTGTGTLVLSGANTYGGGTTIAAGGIRAANSTGSATGSGDVNVQATGTLSGSGTVAGAVNVAGTIAPGASPGTLNTGSETWAGGGSYVWEINDVDAGVGTDPGWDLINVTGTLTITATSGSKFNINLTSLSGSTAAGNVADFDNTQDYTWTILKTTGGITGFDPAAINLNTSGFSNPLGTGVFVVQLANGGNDIVLHFVHPPAIATGPVGGSAECGSSFGFTVSATGTAPLSYQWKHAGTNIPGANGTSLNVTASAQTAGNYEVEVSNAYGTATSGTAALASVDTTAPTITCGVNETLNCGANWGFTVPTVTDACDPNPVVTIVSTTTNAGCGVTFTATRIWQATDASANSTTCTQVVTILDLTAPMITCAPDTTVACNAPFTFTPPNASDGCHGTNVTITIVSTTTNVIVNGYSVTRTWQGADPCGNVATCSQTITVPGSPAVTVNSVTNCSVVETVLTATTTASNPSYLWSPGNETTSSITVTPSTTTTYTCTVTDGNTGCSASASGTITVRGSDTFANSSSITINDNAGASPYPSVITVSGLTATVCRVTVSLNGLTHPFPDDLDIVLVAPNGAGVYLMSDVGGANPLSGVNLTFDDAAASSLPDASQIVSGTFKCSNIDVRPDSIAPPAPASGYKTNLSAFSGINPNGAWSLYVLDDELIDAGQIAGGWSLSISTLDPIADVGVSQTDIPDPVAVGSNLTYSVTVSNHGPALATGVLASDTPPSSGATLVSFTASQGSCALVTGTIWCNLGSLAPNTSATITVVVTATATGTLVNTASVQADEVDFVSANNSSSANTTVLTGPSITTGPQSQVVCAGTDVSFTVSATGDPPLSYQWYYGVNPISGANGTTLNIPGAQPSASGNYSVVVANPAATATASATLTVNPLPTVSVASTTICVGASATLTAVNNASSPTYLWSPGGQTTAAITVSPTTTTTYSVVVRDGVTTCSNTASATVTVNQLTTATALTPVNNACPGTSASFSTTAGGTGPHTYVWRKNGTVMGGQNGPSITIASVAASDAATYCVEVTGTCNTVTNCAALTVVTTPAITSQPQNQLTPMGNTATFSVTATGGALSYQWKENNVDIAGATGSSVTVGPFTLAQSGKSYSVLVSNCAGTTLSAAATLTVTPISGISFDFDTPGQFTNTPYYATLNDWLATRTDAGLPTQLLETPTGGANNSGSVDVTGTVDVSMILHPVSYDFSLDGKTLIASTMVRIVAPTQNNRNTQLAFVTATNAYNGALAVGVNDNNPQGFMSVILQSTAQPALTYQLRLQHRGTAGGLTEVTPTPTPQATLTAGNWYKLVATFQNIKATAADTFSVAASLQDMGANGITPGAVAMSYPATNIVNASLVTQKNMFLAIRSSRSDTGADFWDNVHAYTTTGPVFFVTPPASQTVPQGRQVTFTARVDGDGPYTYQWNKNGSPIPGARNWKYITAPVRLSESGDQYTVTVTGPANIVTSAAGVLTVTPSALAVVSVGSVDGGSIGVQFNQPVDKTTAENAANYLVNGTPAQGARLFTSQVDLNPTRVIITPSGGAALSGPYTVTVQNVLDLSGNPVGVNNSANGRVEGFAGVDINPLVIQPSGIQNSFAPAQFELTGSGADIFSSPDSFRYVYRQQTGDFDVKVRVPYQDVVRAPSKSGFNARISLDPAAPQVLAAVNPKWPARMQYEGTFRQLYGSGGNSYGNNPRVVYPDAWIRFRRVGNTFLRYSSVNGTTWLFDGQVSPSPAFPDTIYLGLEVCPGANGNPHTASFDGFGNFAGYPGAIINITAQPTGSAVVAGNSATLSVTATVTVAPAAGELAYVWQRNAGGGVWTNVIAAGATNNIFTTGPLFGSDNGAQYRVVVKAPGAADVISSTATITVTDAAAPTITAAIIPIGANAQVLVTYSEPMGLSAVNAGNYVVSNTVGGASMGVASVTFLGPDTRNVLLTTVTPLAAGSYGLRVTGVQDLGGNNINPNPTLRSLSQAGTAPAIGPVVVEFYGYLTNSQLATGIQDLTNNTVAQFQSPSAKFAADCPDFVVYSNVFGINPTAGNFASTVDHYGAQLYSYFVPPTNGAYKFFLRVDDYGEFWMNTNSVGSTNPAGATLQISITGNQQAYTVANSVTNTLVAGQRYYIEARFKETTGGDGVTVAVRNDNTLPGQGEVIPASLMAFPDAVAKPTPAVVELYTGLVTLNSLLPNDIGAAFGNGGYPDFVAAVNSSPFIAKNPNVIGYGRYLGYNTNLAQATTSLGTTVGNQANNTFDNYLGRIYANFIVPSNGVYRFWVRADDSCELWLNTNSVNSTDPAGMTLMGVVNDFYNANYRLLRENVFLTAGAHYIEGRWREGTGGDGMTITFRAQGDTSIPPTTEVITGNRLEFPSAFDRVGAVDGQISPINPVVSDGQTVTFQAVNLRGSPSYGVSWFRNGIQVAANTLTFLTQPLGPSDNGATFTMVATNPFSRVERSTTVTVLSDTVAPTILSAVGSQYNDLVLLTFSEPLDPLTAGAAANYQINNGVGVLSATLDPDTRRRVTLRTTQQTPGTTYIITVNNVRDAAMSGNPIAPNTQVAFTAWVAAGKGFYVELFTNIGGGTAVLNLQSDPKYINNWPDATYYTNRFGASWFGNDSGLNNYGVRVSALFSPPTNGLYRFYIRGDDGTQLFMNTNGPAASGRVLIARNDGANSGTWDNGTGGSASPILTLNANTLYFIEALMKEGGGGDHLEVMLRAIDPVSLAAVGGVPAVSVNDIAAGDFFRNMGNPDRAQLTVVQSPPASINAAQNDTTTLRASAYAGNFELSQAFGYQWQIGDGVGGFANIAGAWGPTYTFIAPASDTQYRVLIGAPGTNVAYTTTVHSSPDNKAPFMLSASSLNGTNLDVIWNEPLESTSAIDPFNYTINDGAVNIIVGGIVQREDPRKITITVDAPVGGTFTIFASGISDLVGNFDVSSVTGRVSSGFVALDVGTPVAAGSTFNVAEGEFDVVAGGNDIWNTADVGHLTLTQVTGDFDVHLRVAGLTRPDPIAKGGLMIRESLDANSRTLHASINPSQYQQAHPLNPTILTGRDIADGAQRFATGGATAGWQARPESVGLPSQIGNSSFSPGGVPNAWVRYKREGNMFYAFHGYDGVNWRLYAQCPFIFDKTVYVGMATCAHTASQAANLVTVANYRDVYIPPPPIILVQPSPSSQTVPLHAVVNYSVVASNPPPNVTALKYQWFRNGVAIQGATGPSYTINDAQPGHAGVYTVQVNNDGGTTTSIPVTLNVDSGLVAGADALNTVQNQSLAINASTLLANDSAAAGDTASIVAVSGVFPVTYTANFDGGVPAGATILGTASVQAAGGANNSGNIRLTEAVINQGGSLILNELAPNRRVTAFNASFKLRISNGSGQPADGFSFNFARDLPIAATTPAAAENGGGTGFSFCVDNYQFHPYPVGGVANSSGMKIRYGGLDIVGVRTPAWITPRWVDVNISITPQGAMTVLVDGTNVFGTITLPNYTPTTGRFGFYARTGGEFQLQAVDDLSISALMTIETTREPATNVSGPQMLGTTFIGGGLLHLTESATAQAGSYIVHDLAPGTNVTSFSASFLLQIGNGTAEPADGFSLNFANDLPISDSTPAAAENGGGTGFSFCVDNYRFAPYPAGGTANTSGMKIRYGGLDIAGVQMPTWNTTRLVPVSVSVDAGGNVTVLVDGTNVFGALVIPWVPSPGRFGLYARTGGQAQTHYVDDLAINASTTGSPVAFANDFNTTPPTRYGTVFLNGGVITYNPPLDVCGPDTFYYIISGNYGGSAIGRVDVTIAEAIPTPPTITACATNRNIVAGVNCLAALPDMTGEVRATDNCCCVAVVQNPPPGTLVGKGPHIVTFTATDTAGLSVQCQATITVVDQTPPVIALLGANPFTLECHSAAPIPGATATDDCDGNLTAQIVVGGSVNRDVPGSYVLTYDVSDTSGNPATQMQRTVNVVDTTPPGITCPANITTTCTGAGGATVTFSTTATDVCDASPSVVCTPASGSLFPAGVTTVNCVATDASGNTNRCSFTVTVNDNPAQLSIVRESTNTIVISWPQTCGTFTLQQNDNLGNPNGWVAASETPALVSGRWTVTINTTATTRFYRLKSN